MASPQLEAGWTRIANELLEAMIAAPLNATQYKIMLAVIRATYGHQRKSAPIGYWLIAKQTQVPRTNVIKAMARMVELGYLTKEAGEPGEANVWSVQKDYFLWKDTSHPQTTSDARVTSDLPITTTSDPRVTTTSDPRVTHIKKERKKENADVGAKADPEVIAALIDLGCLRGQAINLSKQNPGLSVEILHRWTQWQQTASVNNPLGLMIKHLQEGRTEPPGVHRNGQMNRAPPPQEDLTMDEIKARAAKYRAAHEDEHGTPDRQTIQTTGP